MAQMIVSLLELALPVNLTVKKFFIKTCTTLMFTVLSESKGILELIDSLTFLDFMQRFFFSTKCSQIIRTVLSPAFEEQAGKGGGWLIEYAFDFSSLH